MKFYFKGDRSKAICKNCGLSSTTFDYRDMILSDSGKCIKNILVGICDKCDSTVSIPAQATPDINKAVEPKIIPLEFLISSVFIEVLNLVCFSVSQSCSKEVIKSVLFYYIKRCLDMKDIEDIEEDSLFKKEKVFKMPKKRISMKVSLTFSNCFNDLSMKLKMNKTDTFKFIIDTMKKDIINNNDALIRKELEKICLFVVC